MHACAAVKALGIYTLASILGFRGKHCKDTCIGGLAGDTSDDIEIEMEAHHAHHDGGSRL